MSRKKKDSKTKELNPPQPLGELLQPTPTPESERFKDVPIQTFTAPPTVVELVEPEEEVSEPVMTMDQLITELCESLYPHAMVFEENGERILEYNTRIVKIEVEDDRTDLKGERSILWLDKGLQSQFSRPVESFEDIVTAIRNHYLL